MAYTNPLLTEPVTERVLKEHHCWENVDRVPNDPETTEFNRTARFLQSLWRESKGLEIGTHLMRPRHVSPGPRRDVPGRCYSSPTVIVPVTFDDSFISKVSRSSSVANDTSPSTVASTR